MDLFRVSTFLKRSIGTIPLGWLLRGKPSGSPIFLEIGAPMNNVHNVLRARASYDVNAESIWRPGRLLYRHVDRLELSMNDAYERITGRKGYGFTSWVAGVARPAGPCRKVIEDWTDGEIRAADWLIPLPAEPAIRRRGSSATASAT